MRAIYGTTIYFSFITKALTVASQGAKLSIISGCSSGKLYGNLEVFYLLAKKSKIWCLSITHDRDLSCLLKSTSPQLLLSQCE